MCLAVSNVVDESVYLVVSRLFRDLLEMLAALSERADGGEGLVFFELEGEFVDVLRLGLGACLFLLRKLKACEFFGFARNGRGHVVAVLRDEGGLLVQIEFVFVSLGNFCNHFFCFVCKLLYIFIRRFLSL